jgi:drug/metabolite transporter (DMT)-like permease
VSSAVVGAVLLSAVLHAAWNAVAHYIPDKLAAMALISLVYTALCLPLLFVLPAPAPAARPYLGVSVALQVVYAVLLARAYRLGEFSQVYPLARGTAPLVVAVAAAALVGERLPAGRVAGVLVISGGLAVLVLAGGRPGRRDLPALLAAVGTGLMIAGYTVVDGIAVRRAGGVPGYAAWLFVLQGPVVVLFAVFRYGRKLPAALHGYWWLGAAGGVLSPAAYALVLWAQSRGALAAVAALRETSVIVGAAIGAVVFRERFGAVRVVAAVLVAAGVLLISR